MFFKPVKNEDSNTGNGYNYNSVSAMKENSIKLLFFADCVFDPRELLIRTQKQNTLNKTNKNVPKNASYCKNWSILTYNTTSAGVRVTWEGALSDKSHFNNR